MIRRGLALAAAAVCALVTGTAAAEPVKIGMITTLSGGGSALGIDIRDGFELALEQQGGTLGGQEVELIVEDDARKPDKARQIAQRMMERDEVDILTGIVWSNLAIAVVPRAVRQGVFYVSPNAGPSLLAGRGCHENYFNVAWQNDNLHEAVGNHVTGRHDRVFLLAPNYPAGKDALAGFKRFYDGTVVEEVYTKLGQLDYAAEIAQIRASDADAVYFFLPGGMGISFIKQYDQSGLREKTPLYGPAFSFDQQILGAVGAAAKGVVNSAQWSPDLEVPANRQFVAAFRKAYDRLPSLYASQGYDAARLIASALEATGGQVTDSPDAFRAALRKAEFDSVRGDFRFGPNHHPIQDIYMREVVEVDGTLTNRVVSKAFEDHRDAYAGQCQM